jgi:hypothetical protein
MSEQILAVRGEESESELLNLEQNIDVIIRQADKRVETLKKVLGIAVKRLSHYDILDQNGKPYIQSSACEKLMPIFGVCLKKADYEKKVDSDDAGVYYIYIYQGTFSWAGGSIVAVGNCTSRDKFFAWDNMTKTYKPLSQVDEASIMKAAYSNMLMNGVTRLLGLKNLMWEQLEEFGFKRDKVTTVKYANGGLGGGLISEAQGKRLFAILSKSMKTPEDLKAHLKEKYNIEHSKEIKKVDYEEICNWVEGKI